MHVLVISQMQIQHVCIFIVFYRLYCQSEPNAFFFVDRSFKWMRASSWHHFDEKIIYKIGKYGYHLVVGFLDFKKDPWETFGSANNDPGRFSKPREYKMKWDLKTRGPTGIWTHECRPWQHLQGLLLKGFWYASKHVQLSRPAGDNIDFLRKSLSFQ